MIAIFNRLSVEEGAARQVVERFASSGGYVQGFPGFVSMQVLSPEGARTRCWWSRAGRAWTRLRVPRAAHDGEARRLRLP